MQKIYDIQWLSRIYALFHQSNPDLLEQIYVDFSTSVIVAAKLLSSSRPNHYRVKVTSDSNTELDLPLDLEAREHQSKGNWMWVTQLDLYYKEDNLLSIETKKRVIDIPYHGASVCAHWLFKNFYSEFLSYFNNQLQTKISGPQILE